MRQSAAFRQRFKAARMLAGHKSAEALAEKIGEHGLGAKVIRNIEQGRAVPEPRDLEAIAKACGVPIEWFVVDFSRLPELVADREQAIRRLLEQERERVRTRAASMSAASPASREGGRAR